MLCEYSRLKSERLAQLRANIAKIHKFFLSDCFIGAPRGYQPSSTGIWKKGKK